MKPSLLVICLSILLTLTQNVWACSCELPLANSTPTKEVKAALKKSSSVFDGEVIGVTKLTELSVVVRLKVNRVWKGDVETVLELVTGIGGGDCGYKFEVGKSYIIYAYHVGVSGNRLGTNICQRTNLLAESRSDISILNEIRKPKIAGAPRR